MRISYEEIFKLPEGAELTDVICTTMSLDMMEQLKIVACIHGKKELELGNELHTMLKSDIRKVMFFFDKDKSEVQYSELN